MRDIGDVAVKVGRDEVSYKVASCDHRHAQANVHLTYLTGGLEEEHMRKQVRKILEGGKNAFRDRVRRLRISLPRRHPDDK